MTVLYLLEASVHFFDVLLKGEPVTLATLDGAECVIQFLDVVRLKQDANLTDRINL